MKNYSRLFVHAGLFLVINCMLTLTAQAKDIILSPKGAYAQINVQALKNTMQVLSNGTADQKEKIYAEIKDKPQNYAPPVFYVLSSTLFQQGKKDEAAFWFYAGQLRARYDANRCADISAREAVAVLNQEYGGPINQYAFQDIPFLETLIPKVVEWDSVVAHNYDQRWINLHGMGAVLTSLDDKDQKAQTLSLPENEWPKIAEETRQTYLAQFKDAMSQIKNKPKQ